MDIASIVKTLEEAVCISCSTNTFKKHDSICSPSSFVYILGQIGFFKLGIATCLEEGKLWIQTAKLCLKIDLVLHSAYAEGLDI